MPAAPPINETWAAMGRSLGSSSSHQEDAHLVKLLSRLQNRMVLMIGDSSLRNQFMQLARVGLSFPRATPVAEAVATSMYRGAFSLPGSIRQPERPDSSNGFWGGFPWLIASTPANATLMYAKVWGCPHLGDVMKRMKSTALHHRQRTGYGGWPPHAVYWNFGLHLLHVFPARPVPTMSIRCALNYEELVASSARVLRAEVPAARLVYRTTNAVCDRRFDGPWAVAARAHHCASSARMGSCSGERLARVRQGCRRRYNMTRSQCADTFMDERNTRAQSQAARVVLATHPARVQVLDVFTLTTGRCDATVDGRHYPRLLATVNSRWLGDVLVW